MMKRPEETKIWITLCCIGVLFGCVKSREFDPPEGVCFADLTSNATYSEVKNRYVDETVQIQEDLIIEGYVISSDEKGNFFSVLNIQNNLSNPTEGFQIEIDMRDSHLFYPVGSKLYIKLKGLYLGKSKDVFKLGGTFTSFGNTSVGRLPTSVMDQHIFVACNDKVALEPRELTIDELTPNLTNTLVKFSKVEIIEGELGQPFAVPREETTRTLVDCQKHTIELLNSGFSDFQSAELPAGNGSITGVLLREKSDFKLAIRTLEDIDFEQMRCEEEVTTITTKNIIISELADPENNPKARFIELYNASEAPVPLNGWVLRRYTNDNSTVGSTIDLSNERIESHSTLVLSPNSEEFEAVYGFLPDMEVGTNTAADSNGDDTIELVDPLGTVIDIFGVVGEDGSGTSHEFEDGRALRNPEVIRGNSQYDLNEWTVYNDSGGFGTMEQPQLAPDDFTPGLRN